MNNEYYQRMKPNRGRYLIIIDANGQVTEFSLDGFGKNKIYIGQGADCNDIVIPSRIISRSHGVFGIDAQRVYYADLGSENGTILETNGHQNMLRGEKRFTELRSGNTLRIRSGNPADQSSILILYTNSHEEGIWRSFPLLTSRATIGRSRNNDIALYYPAVSRVHSVIEKVESGYLIWDNNSLNGTWVNGNLLTGRRLLREKDVIRILNSTLIYSNGVIFYKNNSQGITVEVTDMNKFVGREKKQILNHVSCVIDSNDFVAIVGGSGAGKSTLMNAISGFDKAVQGRVTFNGIDLRSNFNELKSMIGYVPQEDIIYENLTLKKMLYYTAKMKMPGDTSGEEIQARISKVLGMVELQDHQNTYIRKLSGGQKKRASIAVELLADPSVFFLDEPTSGLDPGTEQKLMLTLGKLSKSQGKTIIMVTHTTQSLQLCDKVIFMGQGGRLCFCGTTEQAKLFFETDNLVDIYNMITDNSEYWSDKYRYYTDEEYREYSEQNYHIEKKKRSLSLRQFPVLTIRYMELIKNDLQRLIMLFAQPILIALLLAVVAGSDVFNKYEDTNSILFSLSCAAIWVGLFNSIQEICKERAVLKREYMGNLKLFWYIRSKFFVQTLLAAMQSALMAGIFMILVGKPENGILFSNSIFEMYVTIFLTIEAAMALGFLISSLVKSGDKAMTLAPFVLIVQLLFSGILFTLEGPGEMIAYVTISKWSVESLCSIADLNNLPNKLGTFNESKEIYKAIADHLYLRWGIMFGMMVLCGFVCTVLLRSLAKDSR